MNKEIITRFEEHMEDFYGLFVDDYIKENDIKDFSWPIYYPRFIVWLHNKR